MDIGHMCCNMFHLRFCLLLWFPRLLNVTCDCWLNCLLSLPFLPLNILFRAGRSLHFCLLCKGPFSEYFQIYRLQLSTLFRLVFIPVFSSHFLVFKLLGEYIMHLFCGKLMSYFHFFLSPLETGLSFEKSYQEHNFYIHIFLMIRLSKSTNRQQ